MAHNELGTTDINVYKYKQTFKKCLKNNYTKNVNLILKKIAINIFVTTINKAKI